MPDYRKLRVYSLAQELSVDVHRLLVDFPSRLAPGLRAQLANATASIAANIAEGAGRESQTRYLQFLYIARGSAQEASAHLHLAANLDDAQCSEILRCQRRADVIAAMLSKLIRRIESDLQTGQ